MRRWGWNEAEKYGLAKGIGLRSNQVLMLNSQNLYDSLFSDLAVNIDGKYFIAEFKRDREEFKLEMKSKPHRKALIDHMRKEEGGHCKSFSLFGHFAIYPTTADIVIEPYRLALKPRRPDDPVWSFDEFFSDTLSGVYGLTLDRFIVYMECMLKGLPQVDSPIDPSTTLFGFVNKKGETSFLIANNSAELQYVLTNALTKLAQHQKPIDPTP